MSRALSLANGSAIRALYPEVGLFFGENVMNRNRLVVVTALALTLVTYPVFSADGSFALTNANLFDGVNNAITENATVLVKDGRIERIAIGNVNIPRDYTCRPGPCRVVEVQPSSLE